LGVITALLLQLIMSQSEFILCILNPISNHSHHTPITKLIWLIQGQEPIET